MRERIGVIAAAASAGLGGCTIAATRILVGAIDPLALNAIRFAVGFLLLLGLALIVGARWPRREDWGGLIVLGFVAYVVFGMLFVSSMQFTTAARAGLAFSTMPLQTMLMAAAFGVERLSLRKTTGTLIAMSGVALALVSGLNAAPDGAWRGDLLMLAAVFCMSAYNIAARPYIARSDPLAFATAGMGVGWAFLMALAIFWGDFGSVQAFGAREWIAMAFVSVAGGAVMFLLWFFALGRITPTAAAVSVTANPVTASIAGALVLSEPLGFHLLIGLAAVVVGIWIATSSPPTPVRL